MGEYSDLEIQQHEFENQQPKTFGEIISYLKSKDNCRIDGNGFIVLNLHQYLCRISDAVESIPIEKRKTNVNCISAKKGLIKVFDAYIEGKTSKVDEIKKKNRMSIYGT